MLPFLEISSSPCSEHGLFLCSGGGWQDQVGGLVGGVKVARSRASLPLRVDVERLSLSQDFLSALQQRLILVYTGKTRLARNLLQVRLWHFSSDWVHKAPFHVCERNIVNGNLNVIFVIFFHLINMIELLLITLN